MSFSGYLSEKNIPAGIHRGFRNYFIPHAGNEYKPHALHPLRLAFYGASAILVKLLIALFIISLPVDAWLAPDVARSEGLKIIDATNALRQKMGVNLLKQNSLLERAAYAKVEDMLIKQYFAHISPEKNDLSHWFKLAGYKFAFAGENLAMGFNQADAVMAAWQKSPTHYNNLVDRDFTEIGVSMQSGTLEQVETALIAQMFGRPREASTLKKTVAKETTSLKVDLPEPEEDSAVLSATARTTVTIPEVKIIYPDSGLISNDQTVNLKINHSGVDKLTILDNGQVVWENPALSGTSTAISLKLSETTHPLKIEAFTGGKSVWSDALTLTVDQTAPVLDIEKSKIMVSDSADKTQKIVSASIFLSADTASARLSAFGQGIELNRAETGGWSGRMIVYKDAPDASTPVIPASLTAADRAGNILRTDLTYENIEPVKVTPFEQYTYLKNRQPAYAGMLSNISSIFYKILLVIAIIALALNIFIEIRVQHHHIIASALGLIILLVALIIV